MDIQGTQRPLTKNVCAMVGLSVMYKCYLRSTFSHADRPRLRKPTTAQTQMLPTMWFEKRRLLKEISKRYVDQQCFYVGIILTYLRQNIMTE